MGNKKKLILLLEIKFCKRDYERFGIEILRDNGFAVEVWDLTPLLHPKFYNEITLPEQIEFDGYRLFSDRASVQSALRGTPADSTIISFVFYRKQTFFLYWLISRRRIRYGVYVAGGCHPSSRRLTQAVAQSGLRSLWQKITRFNVLRIGEYIVNRVPYRYLGVRPADFVLAGGASNIFYNSPVDAHTNILWIHYLDYDIYLQERKPLTAGKSNIAVFLDEYLPFHPDMVYCGMTVPLTAEEYYPVMCGFFDKVERELGIKVIIAAHPKSDYDKHPDYFCGRQVVRGQSARLVQQSDFVLTHASYSLNFAVLFKKPAVFLTLDKLVEVSFYNDLINTMANVLNKKTINIERVGDVDWNTELTVDAQAYDDYRHNYIKKTGTQDIPFWQIVANYIKQCD